MDTTQILLTTTLTVTTVFLIVVGIQIIFVLKEFRKTLKKVNEIVEGFEKLGVGLEHGLHEVSGFVTGVKTLLKATHLINNRRHGKK